MSYTITSLMPFIEEVKKFKSDKEYILSLPCNKNDLLSIEIKNDKTTKSMTGKYVGLSNLYSDCWNIILCIDRHGDEYIPINKITSINVITPGKEE